MSFWKTLQGNYINPETSVQICARDLQGDGKWYPCITNYRGEEGFWGQVDVGPYTTEAACQAVIQQLISGIDASTLLS